MKSRRTKRVNSLLREVITDVIRKEVKNPHVSHLLTVTKVEISNDLHHAKVYISVIGSAVEKEKTIEALQGAAGFIGMKASKEVVIRYFPSLTFFIDSSVDEHMHIEKILEDIHTEQANRKHENEQ